MQARIWSEYQKAIFEFVENGTGNAVIEAVPGSGKSTTLVEALNHIPKHLHKNTLFLAFNKKIVEELADKVPEGVTASTFHSFCLKALKTRNPRLQVDARGEKLKKIIISLVGDDSDEKDTWETLDQTVNLAKAYLAHDANSISVMMEKHEIEPTRKDFVQLVMKALDLCAQQHQVVDFTDMIWFVSKFNLKLPEYAFVMVDEAQDSNPGRIDICKRLSGPNTRMLASGDSRQVIYQFSGSCEDSMEQLRKITNARSFPLTISYRCAKSIVAEAKKYVTAIESSPNAIDGVVESVSYQKMMDEAAPGDFILSRINAPLISLCLGFIREGKRCNIQGRDVGRTLTWMIKSSKAKTATEFLGWLTEWANLQYERIQKKGGDTTPIQDRVACLEALTEGTDDLSVVKQRIKDLFSDLDKKNPGHDKIICGSIHRSKGSERPRVWLLTKTLRTGKSIEEDNIAYVGITRAKTHLFLVQA